MTSPQDEARRITSALAKALLSLGGYSPMIAMRCAFGLGVAIAKRDGAQEPDLQACMLFEVCGYDEEMAVAAVRVVAQRKRDREAKQWEQMQRERGDG